MVLAVTTLLTSPQWRPVHDTDSLADSHSQKVGYVRADHHLSINDVLSPDVLSGHPERLGAVVISDDEVVIVQDRLRSWPLLWSVFTPEGQEPICVVSDSPQALINFRQSLGASCAWNMPARDEFLHTGFVTGIDTLAAEIHSSPQGVMVRINRHTGDVSVEPYALSYFSSDSIDDPDEFSSLLSDAFNESMTTLMDRIGSRRLLIPLSGGLDSRLLVSWLARHHVTNVLAFTYGVARSREALVSREVAQKAGIPWHFVDYDPQAMLKAWHSKQTHDFFDFAYSLNALPHVQDWFALQSLHRDGLLCGDDVVLPGHTIVGNMHDHQLLSLPDVRRGDVGKALISHHNILQEDSKKALSDPYRISKIADYLTLYGQSSDHRYIQSVIESYNVHERQTKYINNSVRAYEFFGADWALPMLDAPMWHTWARGAEHFTATRDFYRAFVNQHWAQSLGHHSELAYYEVTPVSSERREQIKRALHRTHLLPVAERTFSAWSSMHSAMSFDALITDHSRPEIALRLLQGRMTLGFWTRSFLNDTWSRGSSVFEAMI